MSKNIISVVSVSKSFPERRVLHDVTFGIDSGDRLGVIGFNGSGKSTLLELLAGELEPDAGDVIRRSGLSIAMLSQDPELDPAHTIRDVVGSGHEVEAVLDRLGLRDLDVVVGSLSGGQRRRLALARTLAAGADLIILDEPTNHLDIDAIDWLEEELGRGTATLVFVTHDRYLLDRLATRVLEIEEGSVHHHDGDYQDYLSARQMRREHQARTEQKRKNLAATELEWLRRSPKARTSKSKARVTRATAIQESVGPNADPQLAFELPSRRLGDKVVDVADARVDYGSGAVLDGVTWHLSAGERLGVVGPNGAGKTTLLRLLGGRLAPTSGSVEVGSTVVSGWYGQDPEPLDSALRVLDVMRSEAEQTELTSGIVVSASQLLERFGFPGRQHATLVGELSGGERRRLELLRVLVGAPNLLLLDEPTNDLDLATLGALEEQLDVWPGALVVATHDRYFLERVCRNVVSIDLDGQLRHHAGGYSAYLEQRNDSESSGTNDSVRPAIHTPERASDRLSYNEQREFAKLEASIPAAAERVDQIDSDLAGTGTDWERATELSRERQQVLEELQALEARWLELADRAE